jgi:phosphoenolpyruvate phosphomutase
MSELSPHETILSRQLNQLADQGIEDVVITTGLFYDRLVQYCNSLSLSLNYTFVHNPVYETTNYIYSIYCAREYLQDDSLLLLHGDLVFENSVLEQIVGQSSSSVVINSLTNLPEKDFKAVINNGHVAKIGIEFFENAVASQPMYYLLAEDWNLWLDAIVDYCEADNRQCYAENALNDILDKFNLVPFDVTDALCCEVDTPEDLMVVRDALLEIENRVVYLSFSTDMIHQGHVAIIKKAKNLGKLTVGVLSDEAVASYKRFPLIPFEERKVMFENIKGVDYVVEQNTLSYLDVLTELKPDYVVHGDDWKTGFQKSIRAEVLQALEQYGGKLIEYPYTKDERYEKLEAAARERLSVPELRRGRLRNLLAMKPVVSFLEAHNGLTGLICEKTQVYQDGKAYQFDGMWISSLCDSTAKGKPDIELVDMTSRLRTVDDIMEVTTKPIILDGDTGGQIEHFVYNLRTLERMGVSAVIIEDKTGLKKNSLFGNEVAQTQDSIENFCAKISAGKRVQKTKEFMIIARIESLILEAGMDDALTRAYAYVKAGADGIMIHSRKKDPSEIFEFVDTFRETDSSTPIVVVPTTFNTVTEAEFAQHGVNIVIYANQLTRSAFPAMQNIARTILENHRAKEADDMCMPIKEILTLIPEE